MKKLTTVACLVLAVLLLTPLSANAASLCLAAALGGDTVANQMAQDGTGICSVGDFTFNFSSAPGFGGFPATPGTDAASIAANTLVSIALLNPLSFSVTYTADDASGSWSSGSFASFTYQYTVTPTGPQTLGLETIDFSVGGASSGIVTALKNVSDGSDIHSIFFVLPTSSGSVGVPDLPTGTLTVTDTVQTIIGALGGEGTPGTMTNTLTYAVVPEPMSFLLAGVGLIGLGIIRSRRSKKA